MQKRRHRLTLLAAFFGAVIAGVAMTLWNVRVVAAPGDSVTFVISQNEVPQPPSGDDTGDRVVYLTRGAALVGAGNCAVDGQYPQQSVIIVDPRSPPVRTSRFADIITITASAPLSNGTRLTGISCPTTCVIGTTTYNKCIGTEN